jgi:hypothetical protein
VGRVVIAAIVIASFVAVTPSAADTIDPVDCDVSPLTGTAGATQLSASDDLGLVAFVATTDPVGENADGNREVFVYDRDTDEIDQVTDTATGYGSHGADLSGDGRHVVYTRSPNAAANGQASLRVVDLDNGQDRQVAPPPLDAHFDTTWAAIDQDGSRIAYVDDRKVMLLDRTAGRRRALVSGLVGSTSVADIADGGGRVSFTSTANIGGANPDRGTELYVVDVAGRRVRAFTRGPSSGYEGYGGSFSGDGRRITVWTWRNESVLDVQVRDVATKAVVARPAVVDVGELDHDGDAMAIATANVPAYDATRYEAVLVGMGRSPHVFRRATSVADHAHDTLQAQVDEGGRAMVFLDRTDGAVVADCIGPPPPLPDLAGRTATSGPFTGGDQYRSVSLHRRLAIGASTTVTLRVQNDRRLPDSFLLHGFEDPLGNVDLTARWFFQGDEVTDEVEAGTFLVADLDPGESRQLQVRVRLVSGPANGQGSIVTEQRSISRSSAHDDAHVVIRPA